MLQTVLVIAALAAGAFSSWHAGIAYWAGLPQQEPPDFLAARPELASLAADRAMLRAATGGDADRAEMRPDAIMAAARDTLAHNPLQAAPLRQLAAIAAPDDAARSERLLRLAERISRRDSVTQLALIETAVAKGDVRGALQHYDRAMVVNGQTMGALLPILAANLEDAEVRRELLPYARREWFGRLVSDAFRLGSQPRSVVAMLHAARGKVTDAVWQKWAATTLTNLLGAGEYALAEGLARKTALYRDPMPGAFALAADPSRPSPFDWTLGESSAASALPDERSRLLVSVASEQTARISERLTLLPPGRYRLKAAAVPVTGAPAAMLAVSIACAESGQGVLLTVPAIPSRPASFDLAVPAACKAQRWVVTATGAQTQTPSQALLSPLSLERHN